MRVFPIPLLSHVRALIRRAPKPISLSSSRLYAVPALAWTSSTTSDSDSEQVKEGNFDAKALELNEIGILRVLTSMKDDPYLALSFLKQIEGNGAFPSIKTYAAVIRIVCSWSLDEKLGPFFMKLIRNGDEGRGFSVVDLLNAIGEDEEDVKLSFLVRSRVFSAFVKAYANLQMFDEAIDIFWEIERLGLDADAHTYVVVVQALHRNNDMEGVERFLNKLLSSETRNPRVFYMDFIEGLCVNQMSGIAYLLLQPLRLANVLVEISDLAIAYRKVIRGLCNEMSLEYAEGAFRDMEECGIDVDVYVCSAIIEGHRRNMNVAKALEFFNEMVKKGRRINCVIVSSILQCYRQMGQFSEAYDLFQQFRGMDITLDKVCYNVAFDALVKLGEVDEAIKLFREMTGEGIAPDVVNYTTLINGCCLQGRCGDAFDLMIEMDGTGQTPDIVTYNVLAGGLARKGFAEEAFETLKLMEARGVKPTFVTRNMVIEGLIAAGKTDEAEAFYESLGHERSRENEASMVKGYAEAGRLDQAFERFIRLDFPLPKNVYFTLFSSLCAGDEDHIGKAQYLLERMWKLGVEPGKSMYGMLVGAWCRVDNVRKAHQFLKVLGGREIIPDLYTYTTMINAYCRKNELKEAHALFKEMKRVGIKPDVVTYTVLLNNIPNLDTKREMEELGVEPDVVYYTIMIDTYCRLNNLKKANALLKDMQRREITPDLFIYTIMINTYCRLNERKQAFALFKEMKRVGIKPDVVTYTVLLNNIPKLDTKEEMEALDVKPDVFYYTVLIDQQCKIGDLKEAERIFGEMIESGVEPDAAPFTALIACCRKTGYLKEAKRIFDLMIESGIKPDRVSYRNGPVRKADTPMLDKGD